MANCKSSKTLEECSNCIKQIVCDSINAIAKDIEDLPDDDPHKLYGLSLIAKLKAGLKDGYSAKE